MSNIEFTENLSKYANPEKYAKTYKSYTADLVFIAAHLGDSPQTIIELACGTGRLAIPLAKQGHTVYGVDIDAGMLEYARNEAISEGVRIHLDVQDVTQLKLAVQSGFIFMTGNSFQHFLTNASQDALFNAVKKHLKPKGEFIFDTRNPILHELAIIDNFEETIDVNGELINVTSKEEYNHGTQILDCTSIHHSPTNEYKDSIKLRYTFPLEMKRLLEQHGFELLNLYGSWEKEKFYANSVSMIIHAKLK